MPSKSIEEIYLERFLSHGYFPAELPTYFTTQKYGEKSSIFDKKWDGKSIRNFWTKPEQYNIPRYGHARRKLSIVNPINQLHVASLIANNWSDIQACLKKSKISAFNPEIIRTGQSRAISGVNFDAVSRRKAEILGSYGRYVKTDIARFYPSIYTHSIAWALLGKDWVKQNMQSKKFKSSYANYLDKAIGAGQEGQTIGIPIGPDTSRVVSELIATELEMLAKVQIDQFEERAIRYVDDIIIGLNQTETASVILSKLSSSFSEYQLEMNAEKTATLGVGSSHSPEWIHYIRNFSVSLKKGPQADDFNSFFEQAFYLADVNPRESVLLYAVKRAATFPCDDENISHLVRWMLYACRRSPNCLSFVAEHLAIEKLNGRTLPDKEIKNFITQQLPLKSEFGHTEEVAWLLFWALEIGLSIEAGALKHVLATSSSVIALLMLDLQQRGLIVGTIDTTFWQSFAVAEGLKSEMWLLCYEASKKGWWPSTISTSFVSSEKFFSDIWAEDIEFYDATKTLSKKIPRKFVLPSVATIVSGGAYPF